MVGAQHIDVLRSLGLVSRSNRRHVSLSSSWNTLLNHRKGTMLLTVLGAGSMGALLAFRYISGVPITIGFPWTGADDQKALTNVKKKAVLELTIAGLQNMGNNCFLNVVLQALASSEILVSFMEECARVIDTQGVQAERATMPLAAAVADLLKELSQGQTARRILSPRPVMHALNLYTRQFDLSVQQDAAEALAHLAAGLQEERDKYLHLRRPVSQSFGTVLDKDTATPQLDHSWLHWPLEGTLGSLMACQKCGFQYSTVFEYFNDVSLPLSGQADVNMIDSCTLEECLDRFTAPELVASVKCSHCAHMEASQALRTKMDSRKLIAIPEQSNVHSIEETIETIEKCSCDDDCSCEALTLKQGGVWSSVHTNALKRLRIGRSPEVLCLQVQRAVVNEMGELRKLTGHVKFPTILDLFPYTVTGQDIKVRSTDIRTQDQGSSLIQMLGQRGTMLSHIRKLQGSGYPSSLFSLEPGIKGGSELSKQTDNVESAHETIAAEDAITGIASEGLIHEDSLPDPGAPGNANPVESREAGGLTDIEISTSDETSKLDSSGTPKLENLTSSTPFCTGLGALADPLGAQISRSTVQQNLQPTAERTVTSRRLLYELLSIVVHHGGPQSGHYTVYRKVRLPKDRDHEVSTGIAEGVGAGLRCSTEVREQSAEIEIDEKSSKVPVEMEVEVAEEDREIVAWFKVSDTNVRRVEELEVQLANASLLFYERLKCTP
ncbi:hypothetical protein M758_8G035000 [Ceratodon purpureus]|nr:hypothetical protein M758_8G035000 [Ceratodon purpureus]